MTARLVLVSARCLTGMANALAVASGSLTRGLLLAEQTSTASTFTRATYPVNNAIVITTLAESAHTELVADVVVKLVRLSSL